MTWNIGDIVETKSGLWEISYIGETTYVLRNETGRLHVLISEEIDKYCAKVEI